MLRIGRPPANRAAPIIAHLFKVDVLVALVVSSHAATTTAIIPWETGVPLDHAAHTS